MKLARATNVVSGRTGNEIRRQFAFREGLLLVKAVIAATGLYTPPHTVSNAELVETFNAYVAAFNRQHAQAIASGDIEALTPSSEAFIEKASGIKSRYVVNKSGVIDPAVMRPAISERPNEEIRFWPRWAWPPRGTLCGAGTSRPIG